MNLMEEAKSISQYAEDLHQRITKYKEEQRVRQEALHRSLRANHYYYTDEWEKRNILYDSDDQQEENSEANNHEGYEEQQYFSNARDRYAKNGGVIAPISKTLAPKKDSATATNKKAPSAAARKTKQNRWLSQVVVMGLLIAFPELVMTPLRWMLR
jgi:hypothetical protein